MLTGLDHAIIGLRDLASADDLGNALGIAVSPGGVHPGWGTGNAIARFGLDYFELLVVDNPVEAAANPRGQAFLRWLQQGEGWLGFALASDDVEGDAAAIRARGLDAEPPQQGARNRPDGTRMSWRTSRIAGSQWGSPLPFIIQHDTPPAERRSWAPKDGHPLGVTRVAALLVAGPSLDALTADYRKLLGREPDAVEEVPALPARRAVYDVGGFRIELLEPASSDGGLADFVQDRGPGLFLATLAVPDLDRAVAELRARGTAVGSPTPRRRAPLLDPRQTRGARFQLVESA
jgi:glyoxalase-like protein